MDQRIYRNFPITKKIEEEGIPFLDNVMAKNEGSKKRAAYSIEVLRVSCSFYFPDPSNMVN